MLTLSLQPAEFNRDHDLKTKPSLLLVAWTSWDEDTSPGNIAESEKSKNYLKTSDLIIRQTGKITARTSVQ